MNTRGLDTARLWL